MKHNVFALLTVAVLISSTAFSQLTILSGTKQATQYNIGQDISTIVAKGLDYEVSNKETKGAMDSFNALVDPNSQYKLAIIPSDLLYYMQAQDMRLNTEKTKNLKIVTPLEYQQIHLVTKASNNIHSLQDLHGKKVAIGTSEQSTHLTASLIKDYTGIEWITKKMHFNDSYQALSNGDIDAFFVVSAAPIEKLDINPQGMSATDKLVLVPLTDMSDWAEHYKPDVITKAEYSWLDGDVATYSVRGLLVVNESKLTEMQRNDVKELRMAIIAKYDLLKENGHPIWKEINLKDWDEAAWPVFK